MTRYGLVSLLLVIAMVTIFPSCADDGSGEKGDSPSATGVADAAVPTFVRVTVTPVPIESPTPTPEPTAEAKFTAEELADPVFPDWLDPELNDEQPEDEVVFQGWNDYLTNTNIQFMNTQRTLTSVNFCADGVVIVSNGEIDPYVTWGATRTAAMSSRQWGIIALTGTFHSGDNSGRTFTWIVISREGGKVVRTGSQASAEMTISRSKMCLEAFPPNTDGVASSVSGSSKLAAPVFPDWLEPGVQDGSLTDDEIIEGWSEYLSNTSGIVDVLNGPNYTHHLCSGGAVYRNNNLDTHVQDWGIVVNRSLSSNSYTGVEVTANRSELVKATIYSLSRRNEIVYNNGTPIDIKRSTLCLDRHV